MIKVMQKLPMRNVEAGRNPGRLSSEDFMFDKNQFKSAFRRFLEARPTATEDEALEFCQQNIPAHQMASEYWLVEQSMQWFKWLKGQQNQRGSGLSDQHYRLGAFEEEPH